MEATKIATMADVREWSEGDPVELWIRENGRAVVRAWNECGNNYTEVDLFDLLAWCKGNPTAIAMETGTATDSEAGVVAKP